jgi:hypothetical protein
MPRILVLTEQDSLQALNRSLPHGYDSVALGFWSTADGNALSGSSSPTGVIRLNEVSGDFFASVQRAYLLAHEMAENAGSYRGVKPLLPWEGFLADAILRCLLIGDLHKSLMGRDGHGGEIVFESPGETQKNFSLFNSWRGSPFRVTLRAGSKVGRKGKGGLGRVKAFGRLAREARRDGEYGKIFWETVETLDGGYRVRSALLRRRKQTSPGGRWFYSSYVNCTRSLARHWPSPPDPGRWVVNRHEAARDIPPGAGWSYLWDFGKPSGKKDKKEAIHQVRHFFSTLPAEKEDFPFRGFISSSSDISYLLHRLLPASLAEIDLLYSFLERAMPEEVWVADQWGSEGLLCQAARNLRIPVHQVQHGALHRFFPFSPVYSDRFRVWGEFWRNVLPLSERDKTEVFNPGMSALPLRKGRQAPPGKTVLFLTSPLALGVLWNADQVLHEFAKLVASLRERGHRVIVRIHPAETEEPWRTSLEDEFGAVPPEVRFSKEEPLSAVLEKTDLAVMYFSTVFLDCLAGGIPVIALGWYPHIWQKHIESRGIVHFARSLAEVWSLVDSTPKPEKGQPLKEFLDQPAKG